LIARSALCVDARHDGRRPTTGALARRTTLDLLHFNLIFLTVGCVLLSAGFAAREYRWATAAMLAGIVCIPFMIGYDIYRLLMR
jgi:hypothetical protein